MNRPSNDYYLLSPTNPDLIAEDWALEKRWGNSLEKYKHDVGYLFVHLLLWFYHHDDQDGEGIHWKKVIDFVEKRCEKWNWSDEQKQDFFEKFGYFQQNDRVFYCKEEEEMKAMLTEKLFYLQQYLYGDDNAEKYKFT